MKKRGLTLLAVILIFVSVLLYLVHYLIFHDTHHIFLFMLGDLAFLPLEVLLVVVFIERLLSRREKLASFQKLNMISGAFFDEIGTHLLGIVKLCMGNCDELSASLAVTEAWTHADFMKAAKAVRSLKGKPACTGIDLNALRAFLLEKRSFLLQLLTNPNILEHEAHSETLWAIFHLSDELDARATLGGLPESDLEHLAQDLQRVYRRLAEEWLEYVEYLKNDYPFLFSLAVRLNPFQDTVCAIVTS